MKGGTPIVSRKTLRELGLDRRRAARLSARQLTLLVALYCGRGIVGVLETRQALERRRLVRLVDGWPIITPAGRAHVAKLLAVKVEVKAR